MNNQQILDIISNLKGRRNYEEKRAAKLGFNSLYDYFEAKIIKKNSEIEEKNKLLDNIAIKKEILKNNKLNKEKSCKCC